MASDKLPEPNRGRIVFYRTQPLDEDSRFGSALRPARLLAAFRRLGFQVDVVAGYANERRAAMAEVRRRVAEGGLYEFLYAEPATTPIPLNERHHLPNHPLMDYGFLSFCRARGIPSLLFYSDVQWRLRDYSRRIGLHKYLYVLPFFYLDLAVYRRVVDVLLVPELAMVDQIPGWPKRIPVWASIPGFDPTEQIPDRGPRPQSAPLRLFYVGGIEPPVYDLKPVLEGVERARARGLELELTICCREPEWRRHPAAYDPLIGEHVRIVHNRTRQELLELYVSHDIAVMPYGTLNSDWAMPVKFPEAIGLEVPVLAGAGTAVGNLVVAERTGWVVEPSIDGVYQALSRVAQPELDAARAAIRAVRPRYSWNGRAEEIADIAATVRKAESAARPA